MNERMHFFSVAMVKRSESALPLAQVCAHFGAQTRRSPCSRKSLASTNPGGISLTVTNARGV